MSAAASYSCLPFMAKAVSEGQSALGRGFFAFGNPGKLCADRLAKTV